jgi:hypothetical protein
MSPFRLRTCGPAPSVSTEARTTCIRTSTSNFCGAISSKSPGNSSGALAFIDSLFASEVGFFPAFYLPSNAIGLFFPYEEHNKKSQRKQQEYFTHRSHPRVLGKLTALPEVRPRAFVKTLDDITISAR